MQRARHRVEHWPARKHVCVCAGSERFSAIAPEPPTSPPPTRTDPLAAATRATSHPHWSAALRPATVADRFPRNRRPPPSKPTRPYVHIILIVIVSVIAVFSASLPKKKKIANLLYQCITISYCYEHILSYNIAGVKREIFGKFLPCGLVLSVEDFSTTINLWLDNSLLFFGIIKNFHRQCFADFPFFVIFPTPEEYLRENYIIILQK